MVIEVDWRPDRAKLRQFGWFCLIGFALIGLLVAWRGGSFRDGGSWLVPSFLAGFGTLSWLVGMLAPNSLRPLYVLLTAIALPIGLVVSNVILALIFVLLFTPIALWFRLRKRDELALDCESEANSFWVECDTAAGDAARYYRPF